MSAALSCMHEHAPEDTATQCNARVAIQVYAHILLPHGSEYFVGQNILLHRRPKYWLPRTSHHALHNMCDLFL